MPTKKFDVFHDINIDFLKKRVNYSGVDAVEVGYAASNVPENECGWLVYRSTFVTNLETDRNFAQNEQGVEDNGFVHSWAAATQVTEIIINKALVAGNILSVKVDASAAITQAFTVNSDTTLATWAVSIAGEAGVGTAVVRDAGGDGTRDSVIVITAAVAGTAFVLTELGVSGGIQQPTIQFKTVKRNDVAAASKTYGV